MIERSGPEVDIGTAKTCHLILTDPTVSRHHCKLRIEGDGVRVTDSGSRNGTFVDSVQLNDGWARPDSSIACGDTVLTLRLLDELIELPLSPRQHFGALRGASTRMRQLFAILERIAPSETTVLLEGETGTGKDLAAEGLHDGSNRSPGPFIVFDCSAVSAQLIESELFGHIQGAFTGASTDRLGAFEAADGGTLFLDEVGELPLNLQPKLLRALEHFEIRRLGDNQPRTVNVRIIAATNRSLAAEVDAGRFREDLFYRLAVVRISMPPLRERLGDIPLLVAHFANEFGIREGIQAIDTALPADLIRRFSTERWPGNVRQLRNAVARALSMGPEVYRMVGSGHHHRLASTNSKPESNPEHPGPVEIDLSVPLKTARDRRSEAFERAYILAALAKTGGNVTRAAELAGVHRKFIHRAIHKYNLLRRAQPPTPEEP